MRLIDADALKANCDIMVGDTTIGRRDYVMFHEIDTAPSIEPNLILPEQMERGDIYEVGETIVVMNHDDYYDLLCKSWEPKHGENLNNEYADCDQFICSECGIELRDWTRVEIDEDDGEEDHYEYVFRFCPNCGCRIKGADDE